MAQATPISINDGLATPVAHTFTPVRQTEQGVTKFYDRSLGVPALFPEIHIAMYEPPSITPKMKSESIDKQFFKAVVKVMNPVADITSPTSSSGVQPAPSQAFSVMFTGTFTIPARSSLAARKDLLAYVRNLLATADVTRLVEQVEGLY